MTSQRTLLAITLAGLSSAALAGEAPVTPL